MDLDHQRAVHVIDDDIHSREADDLVELVGPFIDAAVARHEGTDFLFILLYPLRQIASYPGNGSLR